MKGIIVQFENKTYTHKVLWACVQRQMDQARSSEAGSWYFFLAGMFMGYMTYEAYINYIGGVLAPDIWKNERRYFRSTGTSGKLDFLVDKFEVSIVRNSRPFTSLLTLKKLRDSVAHAQLDIKVGELNYESQFPQGMGWLDSQVNEGQATEILNDLEELIKQLHSGFIAVDLDGALDPDALEGIMASGYSISSMG